MRGQCAISEKFRRLISNATEPWNALRRETFLKFAQQQLAAVDKVATVGRPRTALRGFLKECLPQTADPEWTFWFDVWDEAMHDAALAEAYRAVNSQWRDMLTRLILRGVAGGDFQCADADRAARQIFAMTMGYADELLLLPSKKAADSAFNEVLDVATRLLGAE